MNCSIIHKISPENVHNTDSVFSPFKHAYSIHTKTFSCHSLLFSYLPFSCFLSCFYHRSFRVQLRHLLRIPEQHTCADSPWNRTRLSPLSSYQVVLVFSLCICRFSWGLRGNCIRRHSLRWLMRSRCVRRYSVLAIRNEKKVRCVSEFKKTNKYMYTQTHVSVKIINQ